MCMRAPSTMANSSTTAEERAIVVGFATVVGGVTVVSAAVVGAATVAGAETVGVEGSRATDGPVAHAASVPSSATPQSGTSKRGLNGLEGTPAPGPAASCGLEPTPGCDDGSGRSAEIGRACRVLGRCLVGPTVVVRGRRTHWGRPLRCWLRVGSEAYYLSASALLAENFEQLGLAGLTVLPADTGEPTLVVAQPGTWVGYSDVVTATEPSVGGMAATAYAWGVADAGAAAIAAFADTTTIPARHAEEIVMADRPMTDWERNEWLVATRLVATGL